MRSEPKFIIVLTVSVVCAILLIFYIYIESRDYLIGPVVDITYPINNSEVFGPSVEVRGQTERVNSITLNGSPIFVDQSGAFSEKLILPDGYNIMKFDAKDRFGKAVEKLLVFMVTSTPNH